MGVLFTVLLGVGSVACGRSDTSNNGGGTTPTGGTPTAGPGFDGTTIKVGALTPETGVAAVIGNPLTAGNKLFFQQLNASGGVGGKYKVDLTVADTKYEPQTAVQVYGSTKANVAMYVQILGTAIVDALKGQLDTDSIYAGPASLDAFWVREPNLMPIGAPYQIQMINGLDYAVRKLDAKTKKVCALTKDDPYGETGLKGLEYGADKLGIKIETKQTFKQGDQDFTAQINALQSANCDIVALTALPTETSPILVKAAGNKFNPKWLAQSPTWVNAFAAGADGAPTALAPYLKANFLLLSEGTEWGDESVPGMKKMLDDIKKFTPDQKPDIYFAFGYAQAWAATQILEQAVKNGDLSPKGIIKASTDVKMLTFGNLLGDYTYGAVADRNPPRATTVFSIDPAVPGNLKAEEKNVSSDAAKAYTFE